MNTFPLILCLAEPYSGRNWNFHLWIGTEYKSRDKEKNSGLQELLTPSYLVQEITSSVLRLNLLRPLGTNRENFAAGAKNLNSVKNGIIYNNFHDNPNKFTKLRFYYLN